MDIQDLGINRVKGIIEALFFVSSSPLSIKVIGEVLGMEPVFVKRVVDELRMDYEKRDGLRIIEVAGGYEISTRPEFAPWIERLKGIREKRRLSSSALKTLTIIAYHQPITKGEIEEIRGVCVDGVLRGLLESRLIRIIGRKDAPGRPLLYGTTQEFLRSFGLRSIQDLPRIEEIYGKAIKG